MSKPTFPLALTVFVTVGLCQVATEAPALVVFDDGMEHTIDGIIDDSVSVGSPPQHTSATLVPGGEITGDVVVGEDGWLVMLGGLIGGSVDAFNDGRITVSGGVIAGDLTANGDFPDITLTGGTVMGAVRVFDGIVRVFGTDFRLDGTAIEQQVLTASLDSMLSGIFVDGSNFNNRAVINDNFAIGIPRIELVTPVLLQPGDADRDFDFDELDLVTVLAAGKYLTEQSATWGEGDWDAAPAPGGTRENPPVGDGVFNQVDVLAALQAGRYLTGPYASVEPNGHRSDGQTSLVYNAATGELAVDAPATVELTSINIDSAAGIFSG